MKLKLGILYRRISILTRVFVSLSIILTLLGNSLPLEGAEIERGAPAKGSVAPNEEHWIVQSIVEEVANLASFAADPKSAPLQPGAVSVKSLGENPARYKVTIQLPGGKKSHQAEISIDGSIWSPAIYSPLAGLLLDASELRAAPGALSIAGDPVTLLIDPLTDRIQSENIRVSEWLTRNALDADAHEQAALIVGMLGMRENSGQFWDTRGLCNRATAFLAFAKALRGNRPESEAGKLGELLIGLLADTKRDSAQAIVDLKQRASENPALARWAIASELRNSRDWRVLARPDDASLLERIEFFRATGESISIEAARMRLTALDPETIPDWTRIALQFNFSVGVGHQFTKNALLREVSEISEVFPELKAGGFTLEKVPKVLNKEPGGLVVSGEDGKSAIRVIDGGTWAHFFQRHFFHIIDKTNLFLRNKWGVTERAEQDEKFVLQHFGGLTLAPLLREVWVGPKPDAVSREAVAQLLRSHPEWVSSTVWAAYEKKAGEIEGVPTKADWFSTGLPAGTAYSFYGRYRDIEKLKNQSQAEWSALYEIAPWQYGVAYRAMMAKYQDKPTPEQFRKVMGRFLDYNLSAMRDYAKLVEDKPAEYGRIMMKAAELEPRNYLTLGEYYVQRKMDDEAAKAYQAAFDNGADAVSVANSSEWLINYYYDRGRKDEALALAKWSAEVYSFSGLKAMGALMERMEDFSKAEEYYLKIKERYDHSSTLLRFYYRQSITAPESEYASKFKTEVVPFFPEGIKEVKLSDFSEAPTNGVLVIDENELLLKNKMKKGGIITAVDGKRVENSKQYRFLRDLSDDSKMVLIVYQDGVYQELTTDAPKRRFNVNFPSYPRVK